MLASHIPESCESLLPDQEGRCQRLLRALKGENLSGRKVWSTGTHGKWRNVCWYSQPIETPHQPWPWHTSLHWHLGVSQCVLGVEGAFYFSVWFFPTSTSIVLELQNYRCVPLCLVNAMPGLETKVSGLLGYHSVNWTPFLAANFGCCHLFYISLWLLKEESVIDLLYNQSIWLTNQKRGTWEKALEI